MKRFLALLLSLLLAVSVFSGCDNSAADTRSTEEGSGLGGASAGSGNPEEMRGLSIWHNRAGNAGEILEERVSAFNSGPGWEQSIEVTPVYQGNDLISKLKTLIQASDVKNLPDMVQVFAGDVEYMSTVPYVIPIGDFVSGDDRFDIGDILPQLLSTYTYGDTLYSMPFHASTLMFYWNKTKFAEAGLDPESPPTTIAEMAEIAPLLLKKEGDAVTQYAITLGIVNNYLNHWIGGQGAYSFIGDNESGRTGRMTKVVFDQEGTMATLLSEWRKVLDTGAVQYVEEGDQQRDEFNSGLSAMLITSNSGLASVRAMSEEMGFEFGIGALPKVAAGDTGGVCPGGSSIYILDKGNAGTSHASWEFVKYWVSPENQFEWCSQSGTIPVNEKTFDLPEMKAFVEADPHYITSYECLAASHPKVQEHLAPTQQEFATIFKEVGFKFSDGQLSVDEAVAEMASRCNAALDEYNRANPIG